MFPPVFVGDAHSFAAEQMSVSLSGGSATRWTIVEMVRMNLLTAVSALSTTVMHKIGAECASISAFGLMPHVG